jgi:toxin ParE1/3/4
MKLVYAPRALRDIDEILAYIQSRSRQGAHSVSVAIEHTIGGCVLNPYIGAKTDEPNLYRYPLARYRYTIFYRVDVERDVLEIVRVVHGARVGDLGKVPDTE